MSPQLKVFLRALARAGWWLVRHLILAPLVWAGRELFGQAKTGAKNLLRPLLWPVAVLAAIGFLAVALPPEVFGNLFQAVLVVALAMAALWTLPKILLPRPKKKKKS